MTKNEILKQLQSLGTAQNRKVYARHGVRGDAFGVSYANLGKLKKQIKVDQALAEELWSSGNHDARVLATMIADPATAKAAVIDAWAKDLDSYVITDAFSTFVAKTPFASKRAAKWTASRDEWVGSAGWNLVTHLAMHDVALDDATLAALLATIERKIHSSKNRVRYAMNGALIAIGLRNRALKTQAVAVARRIGKVEVDHGQTNCKTPDAVTYIEKASAFGHRGNRQKRGKA
jgi:3-methyladenine DNA glycosylase AlkD